LPLVRRLFVLLLSGACVQPALPAARRQPETPVRPSVAPARPDPDADIEVSIPSDRATYVFRASRIASLLYDLDCLSHVSPHCSREAFEDDWRAGGVLLDEDRPMLQVWKDIHARYDGSDKDGRDLLAKHPTWGTAIVVLAAHVDWIQGVDKSLGAATMSTLHKELARSRAPFVLSVPRDHAAPLFVLVADKGADMQGLMDRFGALDAMPATVWRVDVSTAP